MEARVAWDARDRPETPDRADRALASENTDPAADARLAVPSNTVLRSSSEQTLDGACWLHLRTPNHVVPQSPIWDKRTEPSMAVFTSVPATCNTQSSQVKAQMPCGIEDAENCITCNNSCVFLWSAGHTQAARFGG